MEAKKIVYYKHDIGTLLIKRIVLNPSIILLRILVRWLSFNGVDFEENDARKQAKHTFILDGI